MTSPAILSFTWGGFDKCACICCWNRRRNTKGWGGDVFWICVCGSIKSSPDLFCHGDKMYELIHKDCKLISDQRIYYERVFSLVK